MTYAFLSEESQATYTFCSAIFCEYFEDTDIGHPQRRGPLRDALFSILTWNVHSRVMDGFLTTNNSVKGWHQAFEANVGGLIQVCGFLSTFYEEIRHENALFWHTRRKAVKFGDEKPYQNYSQRLRKPLMRILFALPST